MEQELKEILNRKLGGIAAGDATPSFDKEQTWEQLASKLPSQKRRVLPLTSGWMRVAAAAMLIGLVVGGLTMKYLESDRQTDARSFSAVEVKPAETEAPRTTQSKTPAPSTNNVVTVVQNSRTAAQKRQASRPVSSPILAVPDKPDAAVVKVAEQEPQLAATVVEPDQRLEPAPRTLHLLDVESEDRTALLNDAARTPTGISFSLYISPKRLPEGRDPLAPSSVLGPIIR